MVAPLITMLLPDEDVKSPVIVLACSVPFKVNVLLAPPALARMFKLLVASSLLPVFKVMALADVTETPFVSMAPPAKIVPFVVSKEMLLPVTTTLFARVICPPLVCSCVSPPLVSMLALMAKLRSACNFKVPLLTAVTAVLTVMSPLPPLPDEVLTVTLVPAVNAAPRVAAPINEVAAPPEKVLLEFV